MPSRADLRQIAFGIWLGLSAALGAAAFLPVLLPAAWLARIKGACPGCFFCGMTRAYQSLWQGDWSGAATLHPFSVILFPLSLATFAAALLVSAARLRRLRSQKG